MKQKIKISTAVCLGIAVFSQGASAKDIVSLGELSWMLENGYSQDTIDDIITGCVEDPDCGFGPIAPPNPNDDRIRNFIKASQQKVNLSGMKPKLVQPNQTASAQNAPVITDINVQYEASYQGVSSWNNISAAVSDLDGGPIEYIWTETSSPKYLGALSDSNMLHFVDPVNLPPSVSEHIFTLELIAKDNTGNTSDPETISFKTVDTECTPLDPTDIIDFFDVSMLYSYSKSSLKINEVDFQSFMSDHLVDLQTRNPALDAFTISFEVMNAGGDPLPAQSGGHVPGTESGFPGFSNGHGVCWNGSSLHPNCLSPGTPNFWNGDLFDVDTWYKIQTYVSPKAAMDASCSEQSVYFRLPTVAFSTSGQRPMELYDGSSFLPTRQISVGRKISFGTTSMVAPLTITSTIVKSVGEDDNVTNPPLTVYTPSSALRLLEPE